MKKLQILINTIGVFLCTTLTACTPVIQALESISTDTPKANMPNPASVYCEQQGNRLENHTAEDGSQTGICIFADGSTCDEWAYFKGTCGSISQKTKTPALTVEATINANGGYMPPGTSEEITDWWGVIKSTETSSQFDDFFERQDFGQVINFGIDSLDPIIKSQIEGLRDSGKIVHLYGILLSNVSDYNGSQVQVERIIVDG